MSLSRSTPLFIPRAVQQSRGSKANLLLWIAKGDDAAYRLFYDATSGLLFGLLLRILGHAQAAEEVLSELYREVRQKASRFGKQNERPLTWLILLAHRRAIERLCYRLTSRMEASPSINITVQRGLIRAAIDSIPLLEQQMVEMAFISGMSHLEIATKLGRSPDVVEQSLNHAMVRLFGLFKSMGFSAQTGPVQNSEPSPFLTNVRR